MNRLQKKCIIASGGVHFLLAVMLILGPAFLSSRNKADQRPPMNFYAAATLDEVLSGGGDNTAKAAPAQAVAPAALPAPMTLPTSVAEQTPILPTPVPVERVPVTRKDPPVKPVKQDAPVIDPVKPKHKIDVDVTPVVTTATAEKARKDAQAKAQAQAQAAADAKRLAAAKALGRAINGIQGGVSGSTEIKLAGPGGGGVPYGNFLAAVKKRYFDAWRVPDGVPNETVRVSVVIARDGTVTSARILEGSGNAAVDNSVQETLDNVKFAAPLPEGAKEDQRSVTINFNTEAKLLG